MENVKLTINGKEITAPVGSTILEAARRNGIYIPTLCYDEAVEVYGACGLCVVEAQGIPKLLRSCSAKVSDGMVINTESERVVKSRKIAMELLMSAHDGDCIAPCQLACPANTDCQGYVGLIANGEFDSALKLIKKEIPLPASIGRVCPHPCEKACRRGKVDEPINIVQLKSFAADLDLKGDSFVPECAPSTGKKVAIVGGGPAGLTAAYYLAQLGHEVTVFDMMEKMGGMLRYGIPQYRLPKEVLDSEIKIIEKTGVRLCNNVKLGKDITIENLKSVNDAVILAPGAWKSTPMRVKGEDAQGVYGGIDFLRSVIQGNPVDIGEKVAVCGGGNTAMDACRTAVRLGATVFLPEFDEMMKTPQNNPHHCYSVGEHTLHALMEIQPDKVARITMLLHDVAKPMCRTTDEHGVDHFYGHPQEGSLVARKILRRLKFDNDTTDRVCRLILCHDDNPPLQERTVRRAIYRNGVDQYPLLFAVKRADMLAQSAYRREEKAEYLKEYEEIYEQIMAKRQCLSIKELAVTGTDLIADGMQPGKAIGETLKQLLEYVLEHPEDNTKEKLMEQVHNIASPHI